ncbi:MAG: hypothetical protein J1E81_06105 [Eubacterium sp.]|nr:hypothetical protein [Eubacterium sp.]
MTEQQKYYLYASRNLTVPDGVEYSLIPMCGGGRYILLYTDKELGDGYTRLEDSIALEQEERAWLTRIKITVNARFMQQHAQEYSELFSDFCDNLEKQLAEEKKKLGDKKKVDRAKARNKKCKQ